MSRHKAPRTTRMSATVVFLAAGAAGGAFGLLACLVALTGDTLVATKTLVAAACVVGIAAVLLWMARIVCALYRRRS